MADMTIPPGPPKPPPVDPNAPPGVPLAPPPAAAAPVPMAPAVPAPPPSIYQQVAAQIASSNQVAPMTTPFDESKGVAGRVATITSQDSPLMQLAQTQGTQLAAKRGLTNSTLAGEAEQNAVLAAATPIASADASLYQQSQLANQSATNAARTVNAQTGAQLGQTGMQLGESGRESDQSLQMAQAQLQAQKEQFAAQLGVTVQDLELRRDSLTQQQQQFLASLDQQMKIAQMTEVGKNNVALTSTWQTMMANIQAIQNNANLDPAAKQTMVQNTLDAFDSYATFWQALGPIQPNIQPLLDFGTGSTPGGAPAPAPAPGAAPAVPVAPPGTVGGPAMGVPVTSPYYNPTQEDLYPGGH